jgi:putative tricarboxylic transport membrane protein
MFSSVQSRSNSCFPVAIRLRAMNFSVVIFIIAFVLGRIWELPLTQAVILTRGDPMRLLNYPVAVGFILIVLGMLALVVLRAKMDRKKI